MTIVEQSCASQSRESLYYEEQQFSHLSQNQQLMLIRHLLYNEIRYEAYFEESLILEYILMRDEERRKQREAKEIQEKKENEENKIKTLKKWADLEASHRNTTPNYTSSLQAKLIRLGKDNTEKPYEHSITATLNNPTYTTNNYTVTNDNLRQEFASFTGNQFQQELHRTSVDIINSVTSAHKKYYLDPRYDGNKQYHSHNALPIMCEYLRAARLCNQQGKIEHAFYLVDFCYSLQKAAEVIDSFVEKNQYGICGFLLGWGNKSSDYAREFGDKTLKYIRNKPVCFELRDFHRHCNDAESALKKVLELSFNNPASFDARIIAEGTAIQREIDASNGRQGTTALAFITKNILFGDAINLPQYDRRIFHNKFEAPSIFEQCIGNATEDANDPRFPINQIFSRTFSSAHAKARQVMTTPAPQHSQQPTQLVVAPTPTPPQKKTTSKSQRSNTRKRKDQSTPPGQPVAKRPYQPNGSSSSSSTSSNQSSASSSTAVMPPSSSSSSSTTSTPQSSSSSSSMAMQKDDVDGDDEWRQVQEAADEELAQRLQAEEDPLLLELRAHAQQQEFESLHHNFVGQVQEAERSGNAELGYLAKERLHALQETVQNPDLVVDFPAECDQIVLDDSDYAEFFSKTRGTPLEQQLHMELCATVRASTDFLNRHEDDLQVQAITPIIHQYAAMAANSNNPQAAFCMADVCRELTGLSTKLADLCNESLAGSMGKAVAEGALRSAENYVTYAFHNPESVVIDLALGAACPPAIAYRRLAILAYDAYQNRQEIYGAAQQFITDIHNERYRDNEWLEANVANFTQIVLVEP